LTGTAARQTCGWSSRIRRAAFQDCSVALGAAAATQGLRRLELRHNRPIRGHSRPAEDRPVRSSKLRSGVSARPPSKDQMTHQFMYPNVSPVRGTAPTTDSGGPASSAGTHNDTVSGPSSRAHKEPRSGPPVGRDWPLRSAPNGVRPQRRDHQGPPTTPRRATVDRPDPPGPQEPVSAPNTAVVHAGSVGNHSTPRK
jgi:hypothetical protein